MTSAKAQAAKDSREFLQKFIAEGGKVYAIIRSVSKSGMSRTMSFVGIKPGDPDMWHLTHRVAQSLSKKTVRVRGSDAVRVNGCGMDMCFYTVYTAFGMEVAKDHSKYGGIL